MHEIGSKIREIIIERKFEMAATWPFHKWIYNEHELTLSQPESYFSDI